MFLTDSWSFIVELEGNPPLASLGLCLVDLASEDDRGDVEPVRDNKTGILGCTLGCADNDRSEIRKIVRVWEYYDDQPFNEKFPLFAPVSMVDFVRRVCDAAHFDDYTEQDILELKKSYGVLESDQKGEKT